MKTTVVAAVLALLSGCSLASRAGQTLGPLDADGELYVYLQPTAAEGGRLVFSLEGLALVRADGVTLPVEASSIEVAVTDAPRQRLLGSGRLPPGAFTALVIKVRRATLFGDERPTDLLVSPEPVRVPVSFNLLRGRATVVSLALDSRRSLQGGVGFAPAFSAEVSGNILPQLAGYVSNNGSASLTAFDKRRLRVEAVIPTGRAPEGVALDPRLSRAYVALAGEDQVAVLDLLSGTDLGRIVLRPGDRPGDLALTPDGRTLLVVNRGSYTVSFVDPELRQELARVATGEDPGPLLLDRGGRRAYVLNRRAASLTVVDLANRAVVQTLRTEPEPVRVQTNRAGDRLYVAFAGSANLAVFSLPDLALVKNVYVGLGASALKVDPRTDLIYVGLAGERRLQLFDPFSLIPLEGVDLPGPPSWLAIDDANNSLLAVLPDSRSVAAVDLTTKRLLGSVEVGAEPYAVTLVGERY